MIERLTAIKDGQMAQLGTLQWSVARLITLAADLDVMDIPLKHLNVYSKYEPLTLREMVAHIKSVNYADLKYPIILDEDGNPVLLPACDALGDLNDIAVTSFATATAQIKLAESTVTANPRDLKSIEGAVAAANFELEHVKNVAHQVKLLASVEDEHFEPAVLENDNALYFDWKEQVKTGDIKCTQKDAKRFISRNLATGGKSQTITPQGMIEVHKRWLDQATQEGLLKPLGGVGKPSHILA